MSKEHCDPFLKKMIWTTLRCCVDPLYAFDQLYETRSRTMMVRSSIFEVHARNARRSSRQRLASSSAARAFSCATNADNRASQYSSPEELRDSVTPLLYRNSLSPRENLNVWVEYSALKKRPAAYRSIRWNGSRCPYTTIGKQCPTLQISSSPDVEILPATSVARSVA